MAHDGGQRDPRPRGVARGVAPLRHQRVVAQRRHVGNVQPPGQQPPERGERGARGIGRLEVPHHRDRERVRVESRLRRWGHGLIDPSRASLEDLAVFADEEVVGDVAESAPLGVEPVDGADDIVGLRGAVAVRSRRVVDEGHLHLRRVVGRSAARRPRVEEPRAGPPLRTADDGGRGDPGPCRRRR